MGAIGQPRMSPSDWKFLLEIWEQLAFWASSLIFVLAALLVPRRCSRTSAGTIASVLACWSWPRSPLVPSCSSACFRRSRGSAWPARGTRFNVVILWGGLRGAVTLALALAVTENAAISPDVQRFVAVHATGFVLFTLLVQGLTLRPLIRRLGLDRLSAVRSGAPQPGAAFSRGRVASAVRRIGKQYRFSADLFAGVADAYRPAEALSAKTGVAGLLAVATDDEQLRLGLVALTQREREIVLEHFDAQVISGRTVEDMLGDLGQILDRTRAHGYTEYSRPAATASGSPGRSAPRTSCTGGCTSTARSSIGLPTGSSTCSSRESCSRS